jgi:DNA polymerase III alpha subunit
MNHIIAPVQSWYSFRRGVVPPKDMAGCIAGRGFAGGILADPGISSGQLEFSGECVEQGVKGAAGVQLEIEGSDILFAAMEGGWEELCLLITSVLLPQRVPLDEALRDASSLAAITPDPVSAMMLRGERGFPGKVFVGVLPERLSGIHPASAEGDIMAAGLSPMAVWPSMFTCDGQVRAHRILRRGYLAIEKRKPSESEFDGPGNVMPDAGAFRRSFKGADRSLRNNQYLAETLPSLPVIGSCERTRVSEEEQLLSEIAGSRVETLYSGSLAARRRMEMELGAIRENGLAGYFLRFFEIVEHCRERGIAVSARGSAGGSLVAYLLGISIICPIQHDLSFSRFFNVLRSSPPDIDLDIDSSRRDQVIEWFLEKSGRRGAAVSQTVTHRSRSAFRVAATGLGMSTAEMDTLTRLLRHRESRVWERPVAGRALEDSLLLRGIPSHLAPHPCGLVCTHGPVDRLVPLHPSAMGFHITHFDKDGVEKMGLLKMDLLGQRGLTTVSIVCSRLDRNPMDVFRRGGSIPRGAMELLDRGATIGVVHVESPAMRGLLREMRIRTMEDVGRALALVRPGAAAGGGRQNYMECVYSGRMHDSCLPELRPLLKENMGVMLYQEDVSRAAEVLLGLDEASSDLLRRKLKKKMVAEEEIISVCRRRCMGPEKAGTVWKVLSGYAGYGFCKAHAFTYAAVACGAAGLKVERPALYMASVMAAGGGFYSSRVYLEEARRLGVDFRPPGVNSGEWLTRERDGYIVPGFHHLKDMGAVEYRKLAAGRPYRYPSDVLAAGCGLSLCRNIAAAGCFGELGFSPPEALMQLEAGDGGFFPGTPPGTPALPDYSMETRVAMELGLLGLPLACNPLELMDPPAGTVPLGEVPVSGGFSIWGRFVTGRRLGAGAGFLMLEDTTGVADIFLPSPLFARAESILVRPEATIIVRGKVERGNRIRGMRVEAGPLSAEPLAPEPPEK